MIRTRIIVFTFIIHTLFIENYLYNLVFKSNSAESSSIEFNNKPEQDL